MTIDSETREEICSQINSELNTLMEPNQIHFYFDNRIQQFVLTTEPRPGKIRKKEIEPRIVELLDQEELITYLVSHIVNLSQPRRDFSRVALLSLAVMIFTAIIVIFLSSFIGYPFLDSLFLVSILLGISIPIILVLVVLLPKILFPHPDIIVYEMRPDILEVLEKIMMNSSSSENKTLLQERIERLRERD